MKKIVTILILTAVITGCQPKDRIYVKHLELSPRLEWLKKDVREFKVPITDNSITYDMSLSFRYASGYQYPDVKVKVTEYSPGGEETVKEYDLKVKDEKGDYIGEAAYEIWDSEHLIESSRKFEETGIYTYVIEHNMPDDPLDLALEIGLVLDKVK